MDLNYNIRNIFPTCIHELTVCNFHEVKDELIRKSYELKKNDPKGIEVSNVGGWHSKTGQLKNNDSTLNSIIFNSIRRLPLNENFSFDVGGWTNINPPGSCNVKHIHPNSNFSGVFWIKAPENSGNIVFHHPNQFSGYVEMVTYSQKFREKVMFDDSIARCPAEGQILIFPSYLEHSVEVNNSIEDRISYSFNIGIKV